MKGAFQKGLEPTLSCDVSKSNLFETSHDSVGSNVQWNIEIGHLIVVVLSTIKRLLL